MTEEKDQVEIDPELERIIYSSMPHDFEQRGCICPAGAEATCKGPLCPRKAITPASSATI